MIELKKMRASIAENLRSFGAHRIIEISSVLRSAHVGFRDQDKFVFYVDNYIDWDQFNQFSDSDLMDKDIRNANAIASKLGPVLLRATNDRLKIAREKWQKMEKMIERRKAEVMAIKQHRVRRGIDLSSEEEDESNNRDNTDPNQANPDQANDKYPVQF